MEHLVKLLRDSYDLQESKPSKSAYWHLQQLRSEIKQLAIPVVSNSLPDKDYWKERCKLVEFIEEVNPCDPDINQEQIEAWNKYRAFLKEHGIRQ